MVRRLAVVLRHDPETFTVLAADNGWTELPPMPAAAGAGDTDAVDLPVRRWRVPGGEMWLVDDPMLQQQRIEIDSDETDAVEAAIDEEISVYDRATCLDVLDLTGAEKTVCSTLRMLTATARGEVDLAVVNAVRSALSDPREMVRVLALQIPIVTGWAEFRSDVARLVADDHSERVRRYARNARSFLEPPAADVDPPVRAPADWSIDVVEASTSPEEVAVHLILIDEAGQAEATYGDPDLCGRAGLMALMIKDHVGGEHRAIELAPETGLVGWERADRPDDTPPNVVGAALLHRLGAADQRYSGPLAITAVEEQRDWYPALTRTQFDAINAAVAATMR